VENKQILVEYTNTDSQLADILMKPLGQVKFQEMQGKIGVIKIK
jgi:hypothetical protein